MEIRLVKEVEILSSTFRIIWDKTSDDGSFSWADSEITIGTKSIKKDPLYTLSVISHEVMEAILVGMGAKFENYRTSANFMFNFNHQTFENAIQIHTQIMIKFIKH